MKSNKLIEILSKSGVAVMATDTIYGLLGSALNPETVKRVYKLKQRSQRKPFIILISKISDLNKFSIRPIKLTLPILKKFWPGPVSIIFPCRLKKFNYLHRGTKSLAFRLPKDSKLINLLKKTGPLVAPSANPENLKPAETIAQAKKYFGRSVDFYQNSGQIKNAPSALIKIEKGKIIRLR